LGEGRTYCIIWQSYGDGSVVEAGEQDGSRQRKNTSKAGCREEEMSDTSTANMFSRDSRTMGVYE
jgi:hypothetical protein